MTPEQEQLILGLVVAPGRAEAARATPEQVLAAFGAQDGPRLSRDLLVQAAAEHSGRDVELTLLMSYTVGLDRSALPVLRRLARDTWHSSHEDIAELLEQLGGAETVDDLEYLAWTGPEFQVYEGSTSLAIKAAHSLERLATSQARAALERLREHPEQDVRDLVERIERRRERS